MRAKEFSPEKNNSGHAAAVAVFHVRTL